MLATGLLVSGMIAVGNSEARSNGNVTECNSECFLKGVTAVLVASLISGFAGCYLERLFKDGGCIWSRNIQLCCFSLPSAILTVVLFDICVPYKNFLEGVDIVVYTVVALQAVGGLIVSGVMKHANSVLKCYAVSVSICVCAFISVLFGSENGDVTKVCGVVVVAAATLMHSI